MERDSVQYLLNELETALPEESSQLLRNNVRSVNETVNEQISKIINDNPYNPLNWPRVGS